MKGGQTKNARLNAVGALCLVLLWTQILAEETKWKESMTAATQALQQRRYTQAEQLLLAALREAKDFGEQDSRLATTLNRLAELYRLQRKYEQAEPLYQRALKIREKALGPEHPDVATTLNNLAFLYAFQDSPKAPLGHKYGQAEPLYQRALAIREKSLGPEHPSVASTLFNLAWLYGRQAYRTEGKHEQAEPLHQRALTIWEKTLGPEHPNVARSLNALASLYYDQGKYEQAEPLYQRSLSIKEKNLGPEDRQVTTFFAGSLANTLDNLANVYLRQGKYEQAEPLYQRSLSIKEKNLGPDHPSLTFTLNPLAELYRAQGKHETAEHFYQRALTIREKARRVATTPENGAAIPTSERDALIALYSSTDGDNWSPRNDNWRKAPGVFNDTGTECTWFGVGCGGGATKTTVLRLDLNSNRLREAIPPELGNLTNLRGLFLAGNQLYTAP